MLLIIKYGYKQDPRFNIAKRDRLYVKTKVWEDLVEPGTIIFTTFQQFNEVFLDIESIDGKTSHKVTLEDGYYLDKEFASKVYKLLIKPKKQTMHALEVHIEDYLTTVNPNITEDTVFTNVVPSYLDTSNEKEEPIYKFEEVKNQKIDYFIKGN